MGKVLQIKIPDLQDYRIFVLSLMLVLGGGAGLNCFAENFMIDVTHFIMTVDEVLVNVCQSLLSYVPD